jgi:ABC-type transport system substrate-binding protein
MRRVKYVLFLALLFAGLALVGCQPPPVTDTEETVTEEVGEVSDAGDTLKEAGAFVDDPNSGLDYNLADFEAEYEVELQEFNESPMLKEMVEAGELPPVEERLPENPVVSIPLEEIGTYGGVLHWVEFTIDYDHYLRHLNEVSLLELRPQKGIARYKWLGGEIMPGVFESWDVNDDATTFTFTIRKGLKWSDGEPVTTEDIRFYI